jgi:hypothetical protein
MPMTAQSPSTYSQPASALRKGRRGFTTGQLTIVPSRVITETTGPGRREQLALACGAFATFFILGLIAALGFGVYEPDALARVYSAARTVHGPNPTIANVGFIWPPLPALAEIPFILFNPLITTGLAAVCMSATFAAFGLILLNRIIAPYVPGRRWRFAFLAAYQTNAMILIYALNGMTEVVMIFFTLLGFLGIQRLFQPDSVREVWGAQRLFLRDRGRDERHLTSVLVILGLSAALGFLTRFEAFSLTFVLLAAIAIALRDRRATRAQYEAYALFYLLPVAAAVALVVGFSWVITGNPLYFLNGKGSNASQTALAMPHSPHLVLLKGDLPRAFAHVATIATNLYPACWIALGALIAVTIRRRDRTAAALALLLVSFPTFQILLHTLGQSFGWIRFHIYLIPLSVVGLLLTGAHLPAPWRERARWATLALLLASSIATVGVFDRVPGKLSEPAYLAALLRGQRDDTMAMERRIATYLLAKGPDVRILADEQQAGHIITFTGEFDRFVGTDVPDHQEQAADPARYVDYILVPNNVTPAEDYIVALYPDIYEQGLPFLTLEREWTPPGQGWWEHSFRLYRVNR